MRLGRCFNGELIIGGLVVFQGEAGKVGQPGYRGDEGPAGPEVRSETCAHALTGACVRTKGLHLRLQTAGGE